jgi:hypothetical protein
MKVVSSYIEGSYLKFVLQTGEVKKFPVYWALSPWLDLNEHTELRDLWLQTKACNSVCCYCDHVIESRFEIKDYVCVLCQIDLEIVTEFKRLL